MKRTICATLAVAFVALAGVAHAADKATPAGTWKWTVNRNGQDRESTLKLKLDGDKLSGTISGRNNTETAIEEASFKDGTVAFTVVRERNGQKFTTKYNGKLDGDSIKGKAESTRDGNLNSRDWEAKRDKA